MSQNRRKTSSNRRRSGNEARGPAAVIFMIIIGIVYLLQQYQSGDLTLPDPEITAPAAQENSGSQAQVDRGAPQAGAPPASQPGGDAMQVWFTDPLHPDQPGPENQLIDAINNAQQTIDMAMYNLTMDSVSDALITAHQRGVVVRLVMESESMEKDVPQALARAGIPIQGDNREGLMHNKFVVIDGQEVWGGSLNLARGAAYGDFNNLVRLRSQRLAQNYTVNFDEMFVDGLFGPSKRANTPYPRVTVDGETVEVYFSPDDGVAEKVVEAIRAARTSIDFMVYSFTSDEIAQAIEERAASGVQVRGIFDESQRESNKGTEFEPLQAAGLDVRLDGISGLLHHKVFIIDRQVVITGSYNFSANAERSNDENLLILHSPDLAARYLDEFQMVYENGK